MNRLLVPLLLVFVACSETPSGPAQWTVQFALNDSVTADVRFEGDSTSLTIVNGPERIPLKALGNGTYAVPVFGGTIAVRWSTDGFDGTWTDSLRPDGYSVPFTAVPVESAPVVAQEMCQSWNFIWEGDSIATDRLHLCVRGDSATGTVSSPTGDLRYLAGTLKDGILTLNTFDGAHLYRFRARAASDGFTDGTLHSGLHGFTRWTARSGPAPEAPVAARTTLLPGATADLKTSDGKPLSLELIPPTGALHIVSIAGTWCPNCMDEARMLSGLIADRTDVRWSVVVFERDSMPPPARIQRWATDCGIPHPPYLGGSASKEVASQVFSWIPGGIRAFPTTAIVYPDGTAWIHVGFDGPATGEAHNRLKDAFTRALKPI